MIIEPEMGTLLAHMGHAACPTWASTLPLMGRFHAKRLPNKFILQYSDSCFLDSANLCNSCRLNSIRLNSCRPNSIHLIPFRLTIISRLQTIQTVG